MKCWYECWSVKKKIVLLEVWNFGKYIGILTAKLCEKK